MWLSLKYPTPLRRSIHHGLHTCTPRDIFEKELFALINPEGHYIVPRFWARSVQPGWTIELLLDEKVHWEGSHDGTSGREQAEADKLHGSLVSSKKLTRYFKTGLLVLRCIRLPDNEKKNYPYASISR